MAVLYTDPEIILQRYVSAEPIVDAYNADVVEGLQFLWRRNAETILAYYPRVAWSSTDKVNYSIIGSNDAVAETERLGMYPMMRDGWRPDVGGDTQLTVTAIGQDMDVRVRVYSGSTLIDTATILLPNVAESIGSGALTLPTGTLDAWVYVDARAITSPSQIDAIYVRSAYDAGAPK